MTEPSLPDQIPPASAADPMPEYAGGVEAAQQDLIRRWMREDIIRRACAQVALERVNNVLGVK